MSWKYSNKQQLPEWFSVADASEYSGLSGAVLYEYINEGCIISSTVLRPGRRRGRRLIKRESLDQFIEEGIGKSSADNIRGGIEEADPKEGDNSSKTKGGTAK